MGGNGGEMEKSLNEERNQCDKEGRKRDGGTKGMNGRREGGEGWKRGLSVWPHCHCHGYRPMIVSVWPLLAERHVTGCGSIGSQLCRIKAALRPS